MARGKSLLLSTDADPPIYHRGSPASPPLYKSLASSTRCTYSPPLVVPQFGRWQAALDVLDDIGDTADIVTYNAVLHALSLAGKSQQAVALLKRLQESKTVQVSRRHDVGENIMEKMAPLLSVVSLVWRTFGGRQRRLTLCATRRIMSDWWGP